MNKRNRFIIFAVAAPLTCLCIAAAYFFPPIHDRIAWRVDELSLRIGYALNPPEKQVFVPQQAGVSAGGQPVGAPAATELAAPQIILATSAPASPTPTIPPLKTEARPEATVTAAPSATAAPTAAGPSPTPVPSKFVISGVKYEDQHGRWNYCAPANLSMALTFWGWQGNRDTVGPVLKPLEKDKNVMPYEMADYVNTHTGLRAALRLAGDLDLLKRLIAAGYPVLVEKGTYLHDISGVVSWMGHYQVVNGYDDAAKTFVTQDSFIEADHVVTYDEMVEGWRAFNYTYIVIYPPAQEAQVMALLGADWDEQTNAQNAALKASNEVFGLSGIDQYFAWFNRGSSLVQLDDYSGAAVAYDEAFKIYPTIPEDQRPWRMLWYQTGPYFAYYYAQRYYDLLYLADGTLEAMQGDKNLEESYYWRGMARAALGDAAAAAEDFRLALQYHPDFPPALYQLQVLGAQP